jgi:hypothetical protein
LQVNVIAVSSPCLPLAVEPGESMVGERGVVDFTDLRPGLRGVARDYRADASEPDATSIVMPMTTRSLSTGDDRQRRATSTDVRVAPPSAPTSRSQ